MARARPGIYRQPEEAVVVARPATRKDYERSKGLGAPVDGQGEWYGHLRCGHGILRYRRPKVGSLVVCWPCAKEQK